MKKLFECLKTKWVNLAEKNLTLALAIVYIGGSLLVWVPFSIYWLAKIARLNK